VLGGLPRGLHRAAGDRRRERKALPRVLSHQLFTLHLCGFCEEACPTYAIQLTPDFEMSEYRRQNLVYEKRDLMINGPLVNIPVYNFYRIAGWPSAGRNKGEAEMKSRPSTSRSFDP